MPIVISKKDNRVTVFIERNLLSLKCHLFITDRVVANSIFKRQNFSFYSYYEINRLPRYKDLLNLRSDFCFKRLKYMIPKIIFPPVVYFDNNDILFFPETSYLNFPNAEFPVENFINSNKKYLEWFPVNYSVLYKASLINVPKQLVDCERLFDKNVIKIKKLVKDIGDLKDLISTEIKDFFLYDDSNFIKGTFFTELNKDIQAYGIISLLDNDSSKRLINSKNKIKFNVLSDAKREFLIFQLEDLLTPQKIQTIDSKITNFSILIKPETMERKIVDQVKIEGLQKFEQY